MLKILTAFFLLISLFYSYPAVKYSQINTIFVIVEENENNKLLREEAPVSDGIYEALWGYEEYIFFDMKLSESLKIINESIDISGFTSIAKASGADSVMLIKVNYTSTAVDRDKIKLKINEYYYKLIFLNKLEVIKSEKVNLNTEEIVSNKEKNIRLKKTGENIIKLIFG